jgi:hypothetical protein
MTADVTPRLDRGGVPTDSEIAVRIACQDGSEPRLEEFSLGLATDFGPIEGSVRRFPPDRIAFEPSRRLGLGVIFTATVSGGDWSAVWQFETRDGQWRDAELVGNGAPGDLVMNANGAGTLLLVTRTGDHSTVEVLRFTGESFDLGASELLRDGEPLSVHEPVLSTDDEGRLLAAWTEYRGGNYSAWARRADATGPWGNVLELLESGGVGGAWLEDATVRPSGRAFLLWREGNHLIGGDLAPAPNDRMLTVRVADRMSTDDARVAGDLTGALWVVWGSYPQVLASRRDDPGHWGTSRVLAEHDAMTPSVALDPSGFGLAGWAYGDAIARTLAPDEAVGAPVTLDTAGERGENTGGTLRLALDRFGNGLALWVNNSHFVISESESGTWYGNVPEVRAQRYFRASGWNVDHSKLDPPVPPDAAFGYYRSFSRRALVLDDWGNGFAGWGHTDPPAGSATRVARYNAHAWNASRELAAMGSAPLVAVDGRGRALAVWSSEGAVYVARFLEPD